MDTHDDQAKAGRVSTGDAGLDRVLGGGFMRGSVAIFQGTPGAGKTTLANQMAFANARSGGRTVYITLLSESHGRMTSALSPMRFFDHGDVGETIHYISGYSVLMEEGARALLQLMAAEARSHRADLVVLDGLFVLADAGLSESEYRKFVNDLALQAELMGCTVLLLTNSRRASDSPEYTMVDGWIELGREDGAHRSSRHVEVHKLRGSGFIPGRHRLRISTGGVEVFPRLESYLGHQPRLPAGRRPAWPRSTRCSAAGCRPTPTRCSGAHRARARRPSACTSSRPARRRSRGCCSRSTNRRTNACASRRCAASTCPRGWRKAAWKSPGIRRSNTTSTNSATRCSPACANGACGGW